MVALTKLEVAVQMKAYLREAQLLLRPILLGPDRCLHQAILVSTVELYLKRANL